MNTEVTPDRMIESLRYRADQVIVNPFGECVWLKHCFDETGVKLGLTECCMVDNPCNVHARRPSLEWLQKWRKRAVVDYLGGGDKLYKLIRSTKDIKARELLWVYRYVRLLRRIDRRIKEARG